MILRAILLMIAAMAFLALSDVFIKWSTQIAPIGVVMFAISTGGTLVFIAIAKWKGAPLWGPELRHPVVIGRNLCEIIGGLGMIVAIAKIDLAILAAIMQAGPLVVTLGAALFLGETVGWRRWAAVFIGILGMLIVIRPFGASFSGWELFAVLGISALSARDLITRLAPDHVPAVTLSLWGFASTIVLGVFYMLFVDGKVLEPTTEIGVVLFCAILTTSVGYLCITTAMRMAPASIVAPFRYTRLVFTTGLAMLIFGERPDAWTLFGAGLILAAGLYSFLRERRLAAT